MKRKIFIIKKVFYLIFLINCFNIANAEDDFSILTLDEAIKIALENNPSLEASKADLLISKSRIRIEKSLFYPQFDTKIVVPFVERESGFFLDQLIYDFGRTSSKVKMRQSEFEMSSIKHSQKLYNIVRDIKIAYFESLIAKNSVKAAQLNLEKHKLIVEKTRQLLKIGRSTNLELTETLSNLGKANINLISNQNIFELEKLELLNIMGITDDISYQLIDYHEIDITVYNVDESLDRALENSFELKTLKSKQDGIKAKLNASKSEFYPVIFGRAAARIEGEGGEDFPTFIAGLGIKVPIFEGFARFARISEANAEFVKSEAEIEIEKHSIRSRIKEIILDLKYKRERIKLTQTSKTLAEDNLRLVKEKYKLGKASRIEMLDAESFYSNTNSDYYEALYSYKIAKTNYDSLIGELNIE